MNNADKNIELKVKEIIDSKIAFDDSNGDKLFEKIIEVTNGNSQTVILDFDGIDLVNTAFLNNAIGRLFDKEVYNIEKCPRPPPARPGCGHRCGGCSRYHGK